jgi:hypothetical protein
LIFNYLRLGALAVKGKRGPFDTASSKSFFGGATPMVFTEQGVAILSSILRSKKAIYVNIAIMRAFVQLRRLIDSNLELAKRIDDLENKYDKKFEVIFKAIKQLIRVENEPRKAIGYRIPQREEEDSE